jgi:acetolactate synthase-1/2/3 large subunit
MTGGELVVRTLIEAGVETLFGLHGAHIDSIFQACLDRKMTIVDTRHEAAAGHAAEGYARAAARMGVALVTAGGGFTNVVTPMANAFLDRTPVLFITGSGPLRDTEANTLQAGIDQVAIARPVTKWAHRITATEQIPRLLAQAIRIVQSPPRGPVLIDIPWDVLAARVEDPVPAAPAIALMRYGAAPGGHELDEVLETLRQAKRPILIVGSEAKQSHAGGALKALVERTGIPAFADYEGLSLLSGLGPLSGGLIQGLHTFKSRGAVPDVVLLLGVRFGLHTAHGSGALLPLTARIVQIDPDARELGRLQAVALGIEAEVGAAIGALACAAKEKTWAHLGPWQRQVREMIQERYDKVAASADSGAALHPFRACQVVAGCLDDATAVVADGALTYLWLTEVISRARPAEFLCHGYLGSMGVGFGVALGCQTALQGSGRRTVLVTGDGAVGYSISEFDTLVRRKLPVIVVVMNNRSWGATLHFQQLAVGPDRITHTVLENGTYHDVAKAFGADGYYVETEEQLGEALNAARAKGSPACINVRVALEPVPPEEKVLMGQEPF